MEMVKTGLDLQLCTLTIAKFDIIKKALYKISAYKLKFPLKKGKERLM